MIRSVYAGGALLLAAATAAGAQQRPPIRQLGAVTAKSAETFSGIAAVRPLSNGSVLVNDVTGRRIIMFDPALSARLKDIYSAGDTRDPMEIYVAFRGREPQIEALLKHRGLGAVETLLGADR